MSTTQTLTVDFEIPEGYTLLKYAQPVKGDLWLNEELQKVCKMDESNWAHYKPIVALVEPTSVTLDGLTLSVKQAEFLYVLMNANNGDLWNVMGSLGYCDLDRGQYVNVNFDDRYQLAKTIREAFQEQGITNQVMGV